MLLFELGILFYVSILLSCLDPMVKSTKFSLFEIFLFGIRK